MGKIGIGLGWKSEFGFVPSGHHNSTHPTFNRLISKQQKKDWPSNQVGFNSGL